jgi:glycosyltransferase involved in cell wall biosynthesis
MTAHLRRIAIIGQPWDDVAPESANSIVIIAYQLARYLAADWRVTLYGRRGRGQKRRELDANGIEFRRYMVFHKPHVIIELVLGIISCYLKIRIGYIFLPFYHLIYALRVAFSIKSMKYDVVLVNNFLQFAYIIKLFNKSATVALIMHCDWLTQFATPANERRLSNIDLITGCSDYITERIRTRFPVIATRCQTINDGVDTARFCPAPNGPTNDGSIHILFVGRLSIEKGVHILIKAFRILSKTRPTLQLDLLGAASIPLYLYLAPDLEDPAISSLRPFYGTQLAEMVRRQLVLRGRSYLGDLIAEAAGDKRIVFHGGTWQGGTIDFYHRAAMLVFPSVWNEPSGLPTLEAQACGLPVVSTYSGGIPEQVRHGETGLLVPRGDVEALARAIGQLLDDPMLARRMGTSGRQWMLDRFTWSAQVKRLADLIEQTVK